MAEPIKNRYDFILLFDVQDGNPNGDPDAGNLPRLDAETGCGLVTDVSIKRKIRNYVAMKHNYATPYGIYVKERAVLGQSHVAAFRDLGIDLGQDLTIPVPDDLAEAMEGMDLPEGITFDRDDNDKPSLLVAGTTDKKEAKTWIKDNEPPKKVRDFLNKALKDAKTRKPTRDESDSGRDWMCRNFYDIRTFGAVMSLKSAPNCGQVRGPVQLTFARSVNPVVTLEHSITRMAVATEAEAEKQGGDNRTMGRKFTVPYGLYVAHGFISSFLARQTSFGGDDLELLWEALCNMFEHDRSAARGQMATRGLYAFKHDNELSMAHAHDLFARIRPRLKDGVSTPRSFDDYVVEVNDTVMPNGVTLIRKCG